MQETLGRKQLENLSQELDAITLLIGKMKNTGLIYGVIYYKLKLKYKPIFNDDTEGMI